MSFLQKEDTNYLLKEDGGKIILADDPNVGAVTTPTTLLNGSGTITISGTGDETTPHTLLSGAGNVSGPSRVSQAIVEIAALSSATIRVSQIVVEIASPLNSGQIATPHTLLAGTGTITYNGSGGIITPHTLLSGSGDNVPPSGQNISQIVAEVAALEPGGVRVSQAMVEVAAVESGNIRLSQATVEVAANTGGSVSISQLVIEMAYIASGETSQVFFI